HRAGRRIGRRGCRSPSRARGRRRDRHRRDPRPRRRRGPRHARRARARRQAARRRARAARSARALPQRDRDRLTPMFVRTALLVLRKDVAVEVKTFEILLTTLFFAVSVVLVFSFAFVREGQAPPDAAAGILWIAIAFAGTLALGRTFERERYCETLRALLLE